MAASAWLTIPSEVGPGSLATAMPTDAVTAISSVPAMNGRRNPFMTRWAMAAASMGPAEVGAEQGELVAAEAGQGVAAAQDLGQASGDRAQQLVADGVSVGVVHELEVVDVQEEHRYRTGMA